MRFRFVTFLASLVLIQSLYAAPIEEIKQKSDPNENHLSNAISSGRANLLKTTVNQESVFESLYNPLTSTVDTPHSSSKSSFKCCWENCNQSFDCVTVLSKHIQQSHIVQGQKYYSCKWKNCNYKFYYISNLRNHLRKHTKERPFVCQYDGCGLSFTLNGNLKQHIRKSHSSREEIDSPLEQEYESLELDFGKVEQQAVQHCDWKNCHRELNDPNELTEHVSKDHIGSGKSLYECQWKNCSYTGRHRNNMINHICSKHTLHRPFICSYRDCGKSFIDKKNLKRHMYVHSSKNYFLCPLLQCDKKYSNIETIQSHLYFHAAASKLSISDVESIWNAFRKKIPYPADISNRINLKERIIEKNKQESKIATNDKLMNESNEKRTEHNADYVESSTNETEGNIYNLESNEFSFSDADLDSTFSKLTTFDEDSVTNDKDNMEATNHLTECISGIELDKDGTELNVIYKRQYDFDNDLDYASKRIKPFYVTNNDNSMNCDFNNSWLVLHDHQMLQISDFSHFSLKATLEQLHSISNELDEDYFIDQYLETL